jgi:hypothetical protein
VKSRRDIIKGKNSIKEVSNKKTQKLSQLSLLFEFKFVVDHLLTKVLED